jgi:outer membrane lipoprotein-sorting protein
MKPLPYLKMALAALLLLIAPVTASAADEKENPADAIVAAVLKAYGGAEAVGRITTVTARGCIVDFFSDTEGGYARYFERPGKLRIEIMPDRGGEVRILKDGHGWQSGNGGLAKARPLTRQSMVYQYSYLDLPMGFIDHSYPVTYEGKRHLGNQETHLLQVSLKDAPPLRVFVDARSFLIVRVAADFSMGVMGASELATEYQEFRPEGGVLFPHRLENFAGDMKISEITLNVILTNPKIPAALFSPPSGDPG